MNIPLGRMYPLYLLPNYLQDLEESNYLKLDNNRRYEYAIELSSEIRDNSDQLFSTLTIAHEFRHVEQHIENRALQQYCNIAKMHFSRQPEWSNSIRLQIPIEADALHSAKRMAIAIFGQEEFENCITKYRKNQELIEYIDIMLNIPDEFNWIKEANQLRADTEDQFRAYACNNEEVAEEFRLYDLILELDSKALEQ